MPVNPYLGFSALTGQVSEYHDIISVSSSSAILSTNNPATQGIKTKKKKGSSYKPRGGGGVGWFLFFLKGIGTSLLLIRSLRWKSNFEELTAFLPCFGVVLQHSSSSPALGTLPTQSTPPRRRSRTAASEHGKAHKTKYLARSWERDGKDAACREVFWEKDRFLVRVEEVDFLSMRWAAFLSHPALIPIVPSTLQMFVLARQVERMGWFCFAPLGSTTSFPSIPSADCVG